MNATQATTDHGHSIAAGEGERIWIVGDTMTLKATGQSTGGSLVLLENVTAPGGGPPPHLHDHEDEFFYVLDGTFEIRIGPAAPLDADEIERTGRVAPEYGLRLAP